MSFLSKLGRWFDKPDASAPPPSRAPAAPAIVPPVDLDVPVTNPALVAALERHLSMQQPDTAAAVWEAFKAANLLVGTVMRDEAIQGGYLQQGERIGIIEATDEHGGRLLALFTDHDERLRFTQTATRTLVMPAQQAMAFTLSSGYAGLVLNPASHATMRLDAGFLRSRLQPGEERFA